MSNALILSWRTIVISFWPGLGMLVLANVATEMGVEPSQVEARLQIPSYVLIGVFMLASAVLTVKTMQVWNRYAAPALPRYLGHVLIVISCPLGGVLGYLILRRKI